MKDDTIYLQHILECIRRIEDHVAGGRAKFLALHTLQDTPLRNLQTMSEATQRLSDVTKSTQPQIPWQQIAAFRNVLVHNYRCNTSPREMLASRASCRSRHKPGGTIMRRLTDKVIGETNISD